MWITKENFREMLANLDVSEIRKILPAKRPFCYDPFSVSDLEAMTSGHQRSHP